MKKTLRRIAILGLACSCGTAFAQGGRGDARPTRPDDDRKAPTLEGDATARFPQEFRSIDGSGNNRTHPDWGRSGAELLRLLSVGYDDGIGEPSGADRPSAREVSNQCAAQESVSVADAGPSDYLWQWGQFVDHDIDLSATIDPVEPFDIAIPLGDPWFDPYSTGIEVIPLDRSFYVYADGVRQQVNEITSFIDASNVYGSDSERAAALRTMDGTGRLKTGPGNLLPWNDVGLANAPSSDASYFMAGDFRANEQVYLTAMHTLFVREHNHWAGQFRRARGHRTGEQIYQMGRAIVAAEMQAITYNEFLPLLLGQHAIPPYRGYRADVDPGIANCFSTAAYRLGHSMLSSTLLRSGVDGNPIAEGNLALADAFFAPDEITSVGIEPYLRGLAGQPCQVIDSLIVDDVRNFLFGPPGAGGFDLASLNVQRGRDHGLPGYNQARRDLGLAPASDFAGINPDPQVQAGLAAVYSSPEQVDLWVGGLSEARAPGGLVGPTFRTILVDQFLRLRDGDRFWYQAYLPPTYVRMVEQQTLARIIRRNTAIGEELPGNVFLSGVPVPTGQRPPIQQEGRSQ